MWTSGGVSTSDAVQVGRQQWRMARAQLSHRDTLISGPVARPAAVRMHHVGKYSVDMRVWIAVIPYLRTNVTYLLMLTDNGCMLTSYLLFVSCRVFSVD